jgi:hypothetical protein
MTPSDLNTDIEVVLVTDKDDECKRQNGPCVAKDKLEEFFVSSANPLHKVAPPTAQVKDVESQILFQADDIRKTLNWVYDTTPSATSYIFPFVIYKPNVEILEKQGFKVSTVKSGLDYHTRVAWEPQEKVNLNFPTP